MLELGSNREADGIDDPTPSDQPDQAPWPGSHDMPRWDTGELPPPPRFTWSSWAYLIGPGLVMGASAIGGGEWLTGPMVTARYGGALLWLAALSIVGQVIYNIETSRYTLYSGEPIFAGKFRVPPGPLFWMVLYLILDFGSLLPYLASNAAVPLAAVLQGELPDPAEDALLLKGLACAIFLASLVPLVFGGKIYNSLKVLMTFKLIVVMGFLLFLAVFYSTGSTWAEIFSGFFRFGTVPVEAAEPGGVAVDNVFVAIWEDRSLPPIDWSMIGIVAAMVAISGNGGLTNTSISNYTRDQGWGMGHHVGAIPSVVGGHKIELSHVGCVFQPTSESLPRWKGWCRHIGRDQWGVWMFACFMGLALPSMLSVQFLPRGTVLEDKWLAAGMTANGVESAAGPVFWYLTLFCGFLVLSTSMVMTADGVLRRWVDAFWIASPRLRLWSTRDIGRFYSLVLGAYTILGLVMLTLVNGDRLLVWSTNIYNYALGFSCWHTIVVSSVLLPRELRPSPVRRLLLALTGAFFTAAAVLTTIHSLGGS